VRRAAGLAAALSVPASGRLRLALVVAALGYLAVRTALLFDPGYTWDLLAYRRWALAGAQYGLGDVYARSDMDYPPLYAYVLTPLGHAYMALEPRVLRAPARVDPALWTALAKLPPLAFDLAIAALLARLGRGRGGAWSVALPAAYLLNPAVVFTTGHWGQPDSVHSFFVLAAFLSVCSSRAWPAFVLLTLASLMKPLAAPFVPLLLLVSLLRHGWKATTVGVTAAAGTVLAVFAPFLLAGQGGFVVARVLGDLGAMPYTSVNAHNVWWLLAPWRDAEAPWLGPLTPTTLGMAAFGAVYAALAARLMPLLRSHDATPRPPTLAAAALVAVSFFMLSTHMHENHLFVAVVLLATLLPFGRAWTWAYAGFSAGLLANLVLHDLVIPGAWPFSLGGVTDILRPSHGRPFFVAELAATRLASLLNLGLFAWLLIASLPGDGALSLRPLAQGRRCGDHPPPSP